MVLDFFDFSRYRAQLMGIAIIMIMLFHAHFLDCCTIGVEYFIFLSAVGLFFSLTKNDNLKHYFKKRFVRILPTYLVVALPFFFFLDRLNWRQFFLDLSGLCVYQHRWFFWFILFIMLCYLVAPFYMRVMKHRFSLVIPFVAIVVCYLLGLRYPSLEIMLSRVPIFLLGLHVAELVHDRRQIHGIWVVPVAVAALVLIPVVKGLHLYAGLTNAIFCFLAIPSMAGIVMLLKKCTPVVLNVLAFLGGITLEIYMLHECVCMNALSLVLPYVVAWWLSLPVAVAAGYLLKLLVNGLLSLPLSIHHDS